MGRERWMHNVPCASGSVWDGSPCGGDPALDPVEITFATLADDADAIPVGEIRPDNNLDRAYSEDPERVADVRVQAWILDVDGTNVVVTITSYTDTSAELIAEAEAIVRSIRVEPVGTGPGRRLVFTLPANWDSG